MKFLLKENVKSLYEEYLVENEYEKVVFKIIGRKEIDEILEIYDMDDNLLVKLKKISYFGKTNFEIYFKDELQVTIGEEINLFKDIFYFELNGWKLTYNEENLIYIVTDIEDENVFLLRKPLEEILNYEIEVFKEEDVLGAVVISIVMYIYDKKNVEGD
ncbi:hypothetical protein [Miniphocaeibacter massiliensis]|uniref:hypothetical protein n=1 Tax=Miniphocaeibacter massiliensis TaxID=2041841 RepID=UPI000C1C2D61|nr:hypothetical protein [Miniphocaeibacter massiliensis]